MLSLVSGRYPSAADEVAATQSVASAFNLGIGSNWTEAGVTRKVVGIVEDPLDTLDEFALVVPGQVRSPSDIALLFDAPGVSPASIGPDVEDLSQASSNNAINPETIIAMVAVLGMVLIALVSVGGFTVLAQRRLRSLGLLAANGATTKHVRLVVRTNGAIVGVVGTVIGAVIGLVVWLAYRPTIEGTGHHVIGPFQLPWIVIGPAMGLAMVATYLAAGRPARTVATVPVHEALSGRPMPPRKIRRSVVPGMVFFVIAFVLLSFASVAGRASPKTPFLLLGLIALIPAVILLAPFCLALGRAHRALPADRPSARAARPVSLPRPVWVGDGRDQRGGARRGRHCRRRVPALRPVPRLRGSESRFERSRRLRAASRRNNCGRTGNTEPSDAKAAADGDTRCERPRDRNGARCQVDARTVPGEREPGPRVHPGGAGRGRSTSKLPNCCARLGSRRPRSTRTPTS